MPQDAAPKLIQKFPKVSEYRQSPVTQTSLFMLPPQPHSDSPTRIGLTETRLGEIIAAVEAAQSVQALSSFHIPELDSDCHDTTKHEVSFSTFHPLLPT
jgi:hypothetical protein